VKADVQLETLNLDYRPCADAKFRRKLLSVFKFISKYYKSLPSRFASFTSVTLLVLQGNSSNGRVRFTNWNYHVKIDVQNISNFC